MIAATIRARAASRREGSFGTPSSKCWITSVCCLLSLTTFESFSTKDKLSLSFFLGGSAVSLGWLAGNTGRRRHIGVVFWLLILHTRIFPAFRESGSLDSLLCSSCGQLARVLLLPCGSHRPDGPSSLRNRQHPSQEPTWYCRPLRNSLRVRSQAHDGTLMVHRIRGVKCRI